MVLLNFDQKDVFVGTTQTQNLGRLLSSVCREAQDVIRDLAVKTEASEDSFNASNLVVNTVRQELWERVRVLRELYLKCIVLVTLNSDSSNISDLVQIGAEMWDVRETVRRRAQEFYEIQWPPMGSYPPPQPPWALDVAGNVLVSRNPRSLPKYAQLAVEQAGSENFGDAVKNIRLPLKTRQKVGKRLTSIIKAEYALALRKTEDLKLRTLKFVEFRLEMGRVHLESPGEFHVTFFTNFRRYQFERYRVYSGGNSIVAPELEIMGSNTLQSACNVVVETFESLKNRALYEVNGWKALINASKETRQKAKDLRMLARWLLSTHALGERTKVPKQSLEQILQKDLFQKIIEAGAVQEARPVATIENIHRDEDDDLFEAQEESKESTSPKEPDVEECDDLDALTKNLYRALWHMERSCLAKVNEEREAYRSIEGNEFTFEFYRFVVLVAARISRYGSLLILRDQARNMTKCTAAPGGVIYVREWRLPPKFAKKSKADSSASSRTTPDGSAETMTPVEAMSSPSPVSEPAHSSDIAEDAVEGGAAQQGGVEPAADTEAEGTGADPASTEEVVSEVPPLTGWKKLFARYFKPPADSAPSLAEEYPETIDLIPFANLFPVSALPVHTDIVEIDFLPGLPLSILSKLLGTTHDERICRLKFGLDQSQAELFVVLEPLNAVVTEYLRMTDMQADAPMPPPESGARDTECTQHFAALKIVIETLRSLPEMRYFYSEDLRQAGSSSLIRGFGGRYLNLTEWIAHSYEILSKLVLTAISHEVDQRAHWHVLKLSDGIELIYKTFRSVKIYINLLTGYIDIHPIVTKTASSAPASLGVDLVVENTDVLVASLNEGDVRKFLTILESIEETLSSQSAGHESGGVVCEEIVLDDDDQQQSGQPATKRTKII